MDIFGYALIICLGANNSECASRTIYPFLVEAPAGSAKDVQQRKACDDARKSTGLPKPDKNYQPAYRGQDIAWCQRIEEIQ